MNELKKAILEKTFRQDGKVKLACGSAFQIAAQQDAKLSEINKICNAENIRICKCQLKCFD